MIKIIIKGKNGKAKICPKATQDLKINTENRNAAIQAEHIQYGPLNVDEPGDYWKDIAEFWDTTEAASKKSLCSNCVAFDISPRMKDCMPGETSDDDGELGYCWMHHFKCHSARSCRTWAKGGPIKDDKKSFEWQDKNKDSLNEKKKKKKDDRCTRIAKRKYDVWPSAYASGAVVKCRQGKIWKGISEDQEKGLEIKIRKALRKEGGAAGMDALVKHTGGDEAEIKSAIKDMDDVGVHKDGDYILDDGKSINVAEAKKKKAGSESSKESSLSDWFGRKGASGGQGGWVDCNTCRKDKKTGKKKCKPCGRQKGEKRSKYPACRPTPGACDERGRGKSWGKKSAKRKKK
jgi:hypothetical protein